MYVYMREILVTQKKLVSYIISYPEEIKWRKKKSLLNIFELAGRMTYLKKH